MRASTNRKSHRKGCGYARWYDESARWQPNLPEGGSLHPLSALVREIMVEQYCTCHTLQRKGKHANHA
jgi:hypothetical protein